MPRDNLKWFVACKAKKMKHYVTSQCTFSKPYCGDGNYIFLQAKPFQSEKQEDRFFQNPEKKVLFQAS